VSEDEAVLLLKKSWGLAPKRLMVTVPMEVLSRLTFTAGVVAGYGLSMCISDSDRIEMDRLKRELSCLSADLYAN
jgi:hypothetical protein